MWAGYVVCVTFEPQVQRIEGLEGMLCAICAAFRNAGGLHILNLLGTCFWAGWCQKCVARFIASQVRFAHIARRRLLSLWQAWSGVA